MIRALWLNLVLAGPLFAAPPQLDIPAEVKAQGDYVVVTPKTDAMNVVYVALSGVEPFPSAMLKDPRAFVLPVRGLAKGKYAFVAVGAGPQGEQTTARFAVLVGEGPVPPPDPPKPPPVDPPPPTQGVVWAMFIRPDQPITPEQAMTLRDATAKLQAKGIQVMNKSLANVTQPSWRAAVQGVQLPAFFVVRVVDGEGVGIVSPRPLPSVAEIERLVNEAINPPKPVTRSADRPFGSRTTAPLAGPASTSSSAGTVTAPIRIAAPAVAWPGSIDCPT